MEVSNLVQMAVTKIILKRKKCKKAKWLSEEALQTAEKRKEAKGKGEKERYTPLNAEFQRTAKKILRRVGRNIQKNYIKKILMSQITMMVLSLP